MKNPVKKILLLSIASIVFLTAYSQGKKRNSLYDQDLKGKVKSMVLRNYCPVKIVGGGEKWLEFTKQIHKYDESGNEIESITYDIEGFMQNKNTSRNKYDEKGNLIEINSSDSILKYKRNVTITYNDNGYMTKIIQCGSGEGCFKGIYKYDEKNNMIEENVYDSINRLYDKSSYKYNDKGNEVEYNSYAEYGNLTQKHTFTYDQNGFMVEDTQFDLHGILKNKQFFKYEGIDKNGNWIKKSKFSDIKQPPSSYDVREIEYY